MIDKNIYTILEKIDFDKRVEKQIDTIKCVKDTENFNIILSNFVFKNFCFGLIRDFYDEILKDETND